MNKRTLFLVLLSCLVIVIWAGKPESSRAKAKQIEKKYVAVADQLYAAKFEVSNQDYKAFLTSLQDDPARYQALNVNGDLWDETLSFSDPVKDTYFSHPAFFQYPVVNVSHAGAKAYCEWLTNTYHIDNKRSYKKVVFRLPTASEWEVAASAGNPEAVYAWEGRGIQSPKGKYLCNFWLVPQHAITKGEDNGIKVERDAKPYTQGRENYLITSPVDAFPSNKLGLYNICGNAAEMIATEGVARGGSWADTGYDVRIQSEKTYTDASPKVGFRVFMEIIEK